MWTISELKAAGKANLNKAYWKCVLVSVVLGAVTGAGGGSASSAGRNSDVSNKIDSMTQEDLTYLIAILATVVVAALIFIIIGVVVGALVLNPLQVGCQRFFLNNYRGQGDLSDLGYGFNRETYKSSVVIMLLMGIKTFLWSLLFIIPGIIKSYEYRMIPYIIADNPGITSKEAFAKSRELMTGNKMKAFVLDLSFVGWVILGVITCGLVGVFYAFPYYHNTCAALYFALNGNDGYGNDTTNSGYAYY